MWSMRTPARPLDATRPASLPRLGAGRTAQAGDVRLPAQRLVALGHSLPQVFGMGVVVHVVFLL